MKQIWIPICLLFMAACSTNTKDGVEVITRPFSAVDSNRQIVLSVGRTFEIVLQSNPTTGYHWILDIENPNVISNLSNKYVPDASNRVGIGGKTTWNLKTLSQGSTSLIFSYQRPWEENTDPTRVVTFSISVH